MFKNQKWYRNLRRWDKQRREKKRLAAWEANGRPIPPPHPQKQRVLREFGQQYSIKILVETGTYHGEMVDSMLPYFDTIYSIELAEHLYQRACKMFEDEPKVHLVLGDSGEKLKEITSKLTEPAVFWLDGHYSGGETASGESATPIWKELETVLANKALKHVIIIDDVHCFGEIDGYPPVDEVERFVKERVPNAEFSVADNSIRIVC